MRVKDMRVEDRGWVWPHQFVSYKNEIYLAKNCVVLSEPMSNTVRITIRSHVISVPSRYEGEIRDIFPFWCQSKISSLKGYLPVCFVWELACEGKQCPCEVLNSVGKERIGR